ncbi:hypothetical protein Y032_0247g58 [Ancylostoma ceylanicum]|uniref:Uncharacterized protein n=1 Tax=Ancylostoma ceylanicum TaxID=53326 RepID=A0A016SDI4_9BILA|nr:hypothetical protein Y032_0247g58 [Ancylostoma ceylanicum]
MVLSPWLSSHYSLVVELAEVGILVCWTWNSVKYAAKKGVGQSWRVSWRALCFSGKFGHQNKDTISREANVVISVDTWNLP